MASSHQGIVPINNQVALNSDEFIVSKTDIKGKIVYANRTFMRISGFSEPKLLGQPHSLIRHPDMPRGAFYLLWKTLQQGDEFFGFVKNLCADGSYYWVFANITPDYDADGRLHGYYSVRRKPSAAALLEISPVYRKMLEIEAAVSAPQAPAQSLAWLEQVLAEKGTNYEDFILRLQDQ
jgi:PAS domain S-box-containing protein